MEGLDAWRFTSDREDAIRAVAEIYGGDPHPWSDRTGEWEVFTEADTLAVQLPADPLFAAYELWGSGGCQRRCDGERCVVPVQDPQGGHLDEVDCLCEQENKEPGDKDACGVTVRLKVVLPDVPGIGVWMLTSGSVYAAMELPGICDLIDGLRMRSGLLIPCHLELQYREEKRPYEKFKRQYHVPTLHVAGSINELMASVSDRMATPSIAPSGPGGKPALPAGTSGPGGQPDSGAGGGEPPGGPGRVSAAAVCARYSQDDLIAMCGEADLPNTGTPREMAQRLLDANYPMDV